MNFGQGEDISGELKKHPNEVWLRYPYNTDEPWSKVSLLKGRKRLLPSIVVALPVKYPNGHPIKSKKLEDLEQMIPFIPQENRQFYLDLLGSVPYNMILQVTPMMTKLVMCIPSVNLMVLLRFFC